MTILHERFDASAIEAEIATLEEQRHKLKTLKDADADLKWEPWPTPAALRIDQKLNELRNARELHFGRRRDGRERAPIAAAPRFAHAHFLRRQA